MGLAPYGSTMLPVKTPPCPSPSSPLGQDRDVIPSVAKTFEESSFDDDSSVDSFVIVRKFIEDCRMPVSKASLDKESVDPTPTDEKAVAVKEDLCAFIMAFVVE